MAARKKTAGREGSLRPRNRILAALSQRELGRIAPKLERVPMALSQVLHDHDVPIQHVYFVESGVASVVGIMKDGTAVETATVGYEGMVGVSLFHGVDRTAVQAFCQIPGEALRMEAGAFTREIRSHKGTLVAMLGRYTEALFIQVAQSSACNRMHVVRERCARWLLQTQDRVGQDTFTLTHRFLAQMLGARRASVTEAAGALQAAGLIEYRRGILTVRDRPGLEAAACECYAIISREFDRLLGGFEAPSPLRRTRTASGGKSQLKEPGARGRGRQ